MSKGKGEIVPSVRIQSEKDSLCCRYSNNKQFIVAGHTDGVVKVYESMTGKPVNKMSREDVKDEVPVTSVHFKPQPGKGETTNILTTYTDGKVILWNYETGKKIKQIEEKRQTLGATYHPKLSKFLTLGDDSAIYLYDEETMRLEHTYEKGMVSSVVDGHSSRVFAAIFHPLQQTEFVSGGWDSVVHFWDLRQPNSLRYIKGVHMCGEGLDISRNGRELMTCSYVRENALQLWHYQTGRLLANVEPDPYKSMLYCGQWMTNETMLIGGTDPNLLRIVSLKTLSYQRIGYVDMAILKSFDQTDVYDRHEMKICVNDNFHSMLIQQEGKWKSAKMQNPFPPLVCISNGNI
ncbi:hypothetical protein J6590_023640 [Homalodisca vitripennis]|nr:hypothetical protein J6590_023640 [Homalodisca vitripennis]